MPFVMSLNLMTNTSAMLSKISQATVVHLNIQLWMEQLHKLEGMQPFKNSSKTIKSKVKSPHPVGPARIQQKVQFERLSVDGIECNQS